MARVPNCIRYSGTPGVGVIKKNNFYLGINANVTYGPTIDTNFWNGYLTPSCGYTIFINKEFQGPSTYAPNNDQELISYTTHIGGTNITTAQEALNYLNGRQDIVVTNKTYPDTPTNGLVALFDSSYIPSYQTSGETWYDISLNGYHATLQNSPTFIPTNDGAIYFNASNSNFATFSDVGTLSNFTINCWFYMYSVPQSNKYPALVCNVFDNVSKLNFSLGVNEYPWTGNITGGFFNSVWYNTSGFPPTANTWTNACVTYDGSNIKLFRNGVLFSSAATSTAAVTSGQGVRIARRWDSADYIDGLIPVVGIWNRAFTNSEVLTNYNVYKDYYNCINCSPSCPTPSPSTTPTSTPINNSTPTPTPSVTISNTPTNTITQTPTYTPTNTLTNTITQTPTNTLTPSITPSTTTTQTPSNTTTNTPTNTTTQTPSLTPTHTPTLTPTNTLTPTQTPTPTPASAPQPATVGLVAWYNIPATGADWTPTNPTNGTAIGNWNDTSQSLYSIHNLGADGGNNGKPTYTTNVQNGAPMLLFDGSANRMSASQFSSIASQGTISFFLVSKFNNTTSPQTISSNAARGMNLSISGVTSRYQIGMAGGIGEDSGSTVDTSAHIHTILYNSGVTGNANRLIYRRDGVQKTLDFKSTNVGTSTSPTATILYIGQTSSGTELFNGYQGEIIIYNTVLTASELSNTERYLKNKWGIV